MAWQQPPSDVPATVPQKLQLDWIRAQALTACEVGSSPTRVQASFLLTVVFGFLVIKGELRRPMPSALPVRSASHARCGRACLALHAHLSLLACRAGRAAPIAAPIAAHAAITAGAIRGAPAVTARLP